jgi:chromosome segregation ATPase
LQKADVKTPAATEQRLSILEKRLAILENLTGLSEYDELDEIPDETNVPLTERIAQLTEQLSIVTERMESECVSRNAMETVVAELTGVSQSLQKQIENNYNMSVLSTQALKEWCENRFSNMTNQLESSANKISELSNTVKHVQEELKSNQTSYCDLSQKLVSVVNAVSELKAEIAKVRNLARRVPTGEIFSVETDNREHHFREYKSSVGLARPHRTSLDLILGDRWIDLAEPED